MTAMDHPLLNVSCLKLTGYFITLSFGNLLSDISKMSQVFSIHDKIYLTESQTSTSSIHLHGTPFTQVHLFTFHNKNPFLWQYLLINLL